MTEIEFYKFMKDNEVEYKELTKDDFGDDTFYFFVSFCDLPDFTKLLGYRFFDDGKYICVLKYDYVVFSASDVLGYSGIDVVKMHKMLTEEKTDMVFRISERNWVVIG